MGKYCLTKNLAAAFKQKLKSGEINPETLSDMTSQERRDYFTEFLGEFNAKNVNALFEKKLLQKNFYNSMINWAKETTGIKEPIRQDLLSRIEKMQKDKKGNVLDPTEKKLFMQDLASAKLGIDVNLEEAKQIDKLSGDMTEARKAYNPETRGWSSEEKRLEYGKNRVMLQEYVGDLKKRTRRFNVLEATAGTLKSLVASLDASFFGRQGIKAFYTRPDIWVKNFAKQFGDIGKALMKRNAITAIKADIYSRPYAMDGTYDLMGLDVGLNSEEAFPSSLPEKIPILGRLYKASEVAYNGAALRLRADIADAALDKAKRDEIDITEKRQVEGLGHLVNSLSGRGSIGKLNVAGKELNILLFSIKFLKSNFDTLTAHVLDKKATPYVKKQAAMNILKIAGSIAGILTLANWLWPDSVEEDPRSSDFGKIKIGNTRFDVSGGMASMVTLAARVMPSMHKGEISFWSKSSTTGKMTRLGDGGYASRTALDVINDYFYGKLSPAASILRDRWKGEFFGGDKFSIKGAAKRAVTPISVQSWEELKEDPNSANNLMAMIAEIFGISVSNYSSSSFGGWEQSTGKELLQFKEKVGQAKFIAASKRYEAEVDAKINELMKMDEYKNLSEDEKASTIAKIKSKIKADIFKEYRFKYRADRKSKKDLNKVNDLIKKL